MNQIHTRSGGRSDDLDWAENIEGETIGSAVSVILEYSDRVGSGPKLHRHPYSETFVIRRGRALFTVGGSEVEGHGGQILVAPANTPHKFRVLGPGPFVSTNIHASPRFITEWLE